MGVGVEIFPLNLSSLKRFELECPNQTDTKATTLTFNFNFKPAVPLVRYGNTNFLHDPCEKPAWPNLLPFLITIDAQLWE